MRQTDDAPIHYRLCVTLDVRVNMSSVSSGLLAAWRGLAWGRKAGLSLRGDAGTLALSRLTGTSTRSTANKTQSHLQPHSQCTAVNTARTPALYSVISGNVRPLSDRKTSTVPNFWTCVKRVPRCVPVMHLYDVLTPAVDATVWNGSGCDMALWHTGTVSDMATCHIDMASDMVLQPTDTDRDVSDILTRTSLHDTPTWLRPHTGCDMALWRTDTDHEFSSRVPVTYRRRSWCSTAAPCASRWAAELRRLRRRRRWRRRRPATRWADWSACCCWPCAVGACRPAGDRWRSGGQTASPRRSAANTEDAMYTWPTQTAATQARRAIGNTHSRRWRTDWRTVGRTVGWTSGWTDGWGHARVEGCAACGRAGRQASRSSQGRTDNWTGGRMDGQTSRRTGERSQGPTDAWTGGRMPCSQRSQHRTS